MTEPWTPAQTWLLIGPLLASISFLTWLAVRWQRRNLTPTERKWVDDWWFTDGDHFQEDTEGEALEPEDVA